MLIETKNKNITSTTRYNLVSNTHAGSADRHSCIRHDEEHETARTYTRATISPSVR